MAETLTEGGALIPAAVEERIKLIEETVSTCDLMALKDLGQLQRAFRLARGVQRLRELITEAMLKDIMALQNTSLGFLTDKPEGGYPLGTVRDVTIEALLRGFRMVGNEVNIIAGRFYGAKAGFVRLVNEIPGIRKVRPFIGIPKLVAEKGATVEIGMTWILNGVADEYERREIAIRVNAGMGADAITGKATRKLYAAVYALLSNADVPEGERDDDEALAAAKNVTGGANGGETAERPAGGSKSEQLAAKLGACICDPTSDVHAPDCPQKDKPKVAMKARPATKAGDTGELV